MTVKNVDKDLASRTLTITVQLDAPVERAWQLWADPRQLERWWGPPTYPATVVDHDLTPGGKVTYYMTGPEGDTPGGWWKVLTVDAPTLLEFEDGFADPEGKPNLDMPVTRGRVTLEASGAGTLMTIVSTFASTEEMEKMAAMGMVEGMTLALGQMDAILVS